VVAGPQYVRNDLRSDLLKLDLLRSYPLRGWSVVLAEAGASTLMLTAIQFSLLGIAYLAFLGNETMVPDLEERSVLLLGSLAVLPPINLLSMLIQNGAALLYPAWVRLGSGRAAGVEVLGQNILMMIAFVALLAGTLILPVTVSGGAFLLLRAILDNWAIVPAAVLGLGVVGFEAALILEWLGRIFEQTDPATAGIAA
jgi:ABC-2 type transport system permease protein